MVPFFYAQTKTRRTLKTDIKICLALKYFKKYNKLFGNIKNILYLY